MRTIINLQEFIKEGIVMLLSRDYGKEVRESIQLGIYDLDNDKYILIFPKKLELISNSFSLGLFCKSFLKI